MVDHRVRFLPGQQEVKVPTGSLLAEAARLAGIEVSQPCGGQGRCGRCTVQVVDGTVRRRSQLRLSEEDVAAGYALACQAVVEGDVQVRVSEEQQIERRLTSDRVAAEVRVPAGYDPRFHQTVRRFNLTMAAPSMDDQTDDLSRLRRALKQQVGLTSVRISLELIRQIGSILREGDWQVTAIVDLQEVYPGVLDERLIALRPGHTPPDNPLWGAAVDIGTTTVSVWLVDLITGRVAAQAAEYNGQIARGEDVISRIIYASKNGGAEELQGRVTATINALLETACKRIPLPGRDPEEPAWLQPKEIVKASIAGNSTMTHLLLNIPAASIRLSPFITAINHVPLLRAGEIGMKIDPEACVDCLPGVASYVGSDISAGVFSSGMDDSDVLTLFIDVGTNGETVLGNREWLVTCACSAGPAFEGAGVKHGMRATRGAIEEVWINTQTFEPTYRVIGGGLPAGVCGSGLISLLAEMFMTGILDRGGNLNTHLPTNRVREGEHGLEYVIEWASGTMNRKDLVITRVDIDNLLRAKAAIYAGFSVMAESVGIPLDAVDQMLIGGSFGKYINIEKAIQVGLLPDLPWEKFQYLGNTSILGAYYALLRSQSRQQIDEIAARMTYIELSADNTFYDAFMSALFLPHTDLSRFPTVAAALETEGTH